MNSWKTTGPILAVAMAAFLLLCGSGDAKKPDTTGRGAAYTIISLPSPDGATSHHGVVESISDLGPADEIHVVGYHYHASDGDRAYCWSVGTAGDVAIEDLSLWFWHHDLDVNSAGVICGGTNTDYGDRSPAVLLPDGTFIELPGPYTAVRLSNPDEHDIFQVVGRHVMWDIAADGTILGSTSLTDANGTQLNAFDVNDNGEIAGVVRVSNGPSMEEFPAVGRFVDGELQISLLVNPSPEVIIGFADMRIDNSGNLLGFGVEPGTIGFYPRAVVWPDSGGSIDLVTEFSALSTAHGNGIATVDSVMQVVGRAHANSGGFPYIYTQGELTDLNRLSEGDEPWDIEAVYDINHAGIICGYGKVGRRRNYRAEACLLVPVKK